MQPEGEYERRGRCTALSNESECLLHGRSTYIVWTLVADME